MTPKRRRATDGPEIRNRAAHAVAHHPWWSLSTLASLAVILPALIYLGGWVGGLIETPWSAEKRETKLRAEFTAMRDVAVADEKKDYAAMLSDLAKFRADFEGWRASQDRQTAGQTLMSLETRMIVAQKWVNDCKIMREKKMSPMEMQACFQYDADYAEARRRYENAQSSAMQTWRAR